MNIPTKYLLGDGTIAFILKNKVRLIVYCGGLALAATACGASPAAPDTQATVDAAVAATGYRQSNVPRETRP